MFVSRRSADVVFRELRYGSPSLRQRFQVCGLSCHSFLLVALVIFLNCYEKLGNS